jgi:uncharacterized protein (DUF1501 family)
MTDPPSAGPQPAPSAAPRHSVSRRRFLAGTGAMAAVGATSGLVLAHRSAWASATPDASSVTTPTRTDTHPGVLVLVTLYGGNDGLNTVVPAEDPAYRAGRPNLGYQPGEVLDLADGLGLNPKLAGMKQLWDAGHLAVVRGVGYPNPSLSHFQSMDIWQTANPSTEGVGWVGRWLDATGTDPMRAISIGATLPPALRGERSAATALTSSSITLPGGPALHHAYTALMAPSVERTGMAATVSGTGSDLLSAQRDIDDLDSAPATGPRTPTTPATTTTPPTTTVGSAGTLGGSRSNAGSSLADQLAIVSSLIREGAPTQVYQVSLSSFDTHADEKSTHERMLAELDAGVSSFLASLHNTAGADRVVLMTYSEFGRRVAENASGGTDHGTASPLFVAGTGIRGGRFYGEEPSLTDLDDGDLRFNVDFRSVYATVLERVLGVDAPSVLGSRFPALDFV